MTAHPTISILINNFNYAAFLGEAIQSAVDQGDGIEVVVVDDGSTDNSADVAASFGDRIRWIAKPNGGQGSAFNTGLGAVTGSHVMLLDADDLLVPGAVDRAVNALLSRPDATMILHRLELIDGSGRSKAKTLPVAGAPLPEGDLRHRVLRSPDDIAWQPTSGITLQLDAARRVLPVPEAEFRICADAYLSNTVGLLGPVAAVDEVGALYRIHGSNAYFRSAFDLERTTAIIAQTDVTHAAIRKLSVETGQRSAGDELALQSVTDQAARLLVRRLSGGSAVVELPAWRYTIAGIRAASSRRDRSLIKRAAMMGWFVVAAIAPRRTLPRLARMALTR